MVPTRPVPTAVDQALQAVLPEIFKGPAAQQPSAPSTAVLREGLAVLHDVLKVAGQPGDLKPLVAALSDSVRLPDIAAAGTKAAREEAAGVLEALVQTACTAIGPGRDGAALAALYGHSPALDQAVTALRTEAATQFMLAHEARRAGHGDAAALPAAVREGARRDAQALTQAECGIAQTKLQIVRALGSGDGFVPALAGLRFTPELAQGLRHANAGSGSQAGVLMGALLAQERALAESPAGQRMLAAVQSQLRVKQAEAPASAAVREPPAATTAPPAARTEGKSASRESATSGTKHRSSTAAANGEPAQSSPREACAGRTQFALFRCMQAQCGRSRWYAHPECARLRKEEDAG